jgi:RNA:NAD 2'-phosphotransferase (TPT1/KptA family)
MIKSRRHNRLLAALFSGSHRDKTRFVLLIDVGDYLFLDIAAIRSNQGHAIPIVTMTTDAWLSQRVRERMMHAYHVTKAENVKSIMGDGLKPGYELVLEGGRDDVRLSPFGPTDARSKEILGKRMKKVTSWQKEMVLVVINMTLGTDETYRIVASNGVILTGETIPPSSFESVRLMTRKPFSAWRDQHDESECNYACLYDAHRKEEIKHVTRENLHKAGQLLDRIRAAHRDRHNALHNAQDVREIHRILDGIEISKSEDYPLGWVDLPKCRCAQCACPNLVGLTSCYYCDGDFVLPVFDDSRPAPPLRNSHTPKAPPSTPSTPPPGEWKYTTHPEIAGQKPTGLRESLLQIHVRQKL